MKNVVFAIYLYGNNKFNNDHFLNYTLIGIKKQFTRSNSFQENLWNFNLKEMYP